MHERPMVLVTIYPDGWVETRSTDDVRVKIHTIPPIGDTPASAEHGISEVARRIAYEELPVPWQQLVSEVDARNVQAGMPDTLSIEERFGRAVPWVVCDTFAAKVEADDSLRLDLVSVTIPDWMKEER